MNNTASSTSRRTNCRLVAVARSELANATRAPLVQAQKPVVPVAPVALVAPVVPVASTDPNISLSLEQVLAVVESTNQKIDALTALVTKMGETVTNVSTAVTLSTQNDAFLKTAIKDIIDSQRVINDYVKKPDLKSTDEEIVAENNTRPGWSLTTGFMSTHNQALAIALISYLRKQEDSFGIRPNDPERIMKNHYRNQSRLLKRRELAYKRYKQNIDTLMGRTDCSNVFQIKVLSDDESDDGRKVRAFRPSWRSDELQTFLDTVDRFAKDGLGNRANSLLERNRVIRPKDLPSSFDPPLPDWAIKN
ncbi:hypothetical protein PHYBLDRAFT_151663 [Phycomyces blakesleeanus NRRL 1555(-)]|uniref:Uncharacterized protein n=1 Tax=Phycomyces blakesleeanus (strain ATCC 8743b / DSM 1359 / FGSC 10004 / NBRC 33097 / NRRL 1555) TaxID=763407 RepID=A0A167K7B4_PHYB8|nr:hypothetical protein PHYBLDRAFT_151663 [Phycomyces blakesleeanus NRRL 1555(-)]OAD67410.1 hypothetical protein PHYBLDRAFT_151663 [Phycomyces blakesleeanus NRRL 1555(-)]|eukprot:XP_018285450.1 hypothetical protein PHYBLDRAFT_151663 [Phycomyces blakesleeanus NRRL 1555(-)]